MPWKRSSSMSRSACMPNGARATQAAHARGAPPYAYCPGRRGSYRSKEHPPGAAGWNPNRKRGIIPMKTTQQKPTETAPPAAMPDTPPDHTYCLDMYENNEVSIDSYELTRAEFNTLKQHLAGLRGIIPAVTPAEPATEPTTAPQTKLDPMDVRLSNLSPEQEQEVHAALLSRLQQQLAGMEICRIQSIAWYADMEEADRGCDTPAQDFLTTLVLHDHVRPL